MEMKHVLTGLLAASAAVLIGACGIEKPDFEESANLLIIQALDSGGVAVAGASIEMSSSNFVYKEIFYTDEEGRLVVENLPSGDYYVQANKRTDVLYGLLTAQKKVRLENEIERVDTLVMSFVPLSPVVINEIHFCGCNAAAYYTQDQFLELYNSTADTIYLDGYHMCRSTQVENLIGIDIEREPFAIAYYVYQFPGIRGETREVPIGPYDYLVIAQDAINHNKYGALCVDMSKADYEFFNAASNDYDNLSVPNLTPITYVGNDFSYNLFHCAMWIATGEEFEFQEHCYFSGTSLICSPYVHVPLRYIIDGVEYSSSPTSPRYMTIRIDAGYGGNGVTRYSGRSIERKVPGFDSNNSAFDFETIFPPTPGYSHIR